MLRFPLKPTKQRNFTKKIYGFDIETYNNNKDFYCATIYNDEIGSKTFFNKDCLIEYFKLPQFKNSYVAATMLDFDFFGTFFNREEVINFITQWRGSSLIFARTYLEDGKFYQQRPSDRARTLTFIDTRNYASLSVEKMGIILNYFKLEKPSFLGHRPKDEQEKKQLVEYNIKDAEISYRFIKFLFDSFIELGASPQLTIASTSMSIFKNKYLNDIYYPHCIDDLQDQFKAYYGGRVEVFERGLIPENKYSMYDINSLYPRVMLNEFPNPNSMRKNKTNDVSYIESYDGVSKVDIYCPDMEYPLLPHRSDKLLFPIGSFSGWYSNVELREAMKLGYVIKKIHRNIFFKENCVPFLDFVKDLYNKRHYYKQQNNPMEYVIKILMNSLYGKFGQKFTERDNWLPLPETLEELNKYDFIERVGNYVRVKQEFTTPKNFCFPIWSLYISAYARLKMYELIQRYRPLYTDTDSLITDKFIHTSDDLGKLSKVCDIKTGFIVKPKFYGLIDRDNNERVKIKGLGTFFTYKQFLEFLKNPEITYEKFIKFKEAMRRGFIPNEIIDITKKMDLEDNKRQWLEKINFNLLQTSKPLKLSAAMEQKTNELRGVPSWERLIMAKNLH